MIKNRQLEKLRMDREPVRGEKLKLCLNRSCENMTPFLSFYVGQIG